MIHTCSRRWTLHWSPSSLTPDGSPLSRTRSTCSVTHSSHIWRTRSSRSSSRSPASASMPGKFYVVYETGRSALVVPVPDAERPWASAGPASLVAPLGIFGHITVLYPFLSEDRLTQAVVDRLTEICADTRAMDVEVGQARRFPGMLYLAPEPDDGFRRLIDAVVQEWPEAPPYGGAHGRQHPAPHGRP